jgi:hypothetical protein
MISTLCYYNWSEVLVVEGRMVGGYIRKPKARREPKIRRSCLKCNSPFIARGRFNRLCPKCAKANESFALRNMRTIIRGI